MESFSLSEVDRKLANLIRLGTVKEADYRKARVRIQMGKLLTDWLPWVTSRAGQDSSWSAPSVGEQVVLLSPCGDMGQGVVLPAIYQQKHPAPSAQETEATVLFQDGSQLTYDKKTHHFTVMLISEGTLTLKVGNSSLEMNQKGIKLKANRIDLNE
jgi:phage baseplate assembly protein V